MSAAGRALVLGGSGLIGAPVTRALVAAGHDVTVVTRGARPLPAGARPLLADRRDAAALAGALAGARFDIAFDLLAYDDADVRALFASPGLRLARYVMISTGQVYLVGAERRPPFAETDAAIPPMPEPPPSAARDHANWVYGMGKRAAERAAHACAAAAGTRVTVLRLPVVQGARDGSRRLWAYLQRLRDGGPLLLPEGGDDPVRFVWAEDVGRAAAALAGEAGARAVAPAYNLAQPDEPSLRELLARAAALLGVTPRFVACEWADLDAAGIERTFSPYSGPWCSRPDPALAARDWGFAATAVAGWLPEVVRAHLAESDPAPHPAYARRAAEFALAARLAGR